MKDQKVHIDSIVNKLKVLDSRIQKLESLTQEVLNEVETTYNRQIENLHVKKDAMRQKLADIQETGTPSDQEK